MKNATQLRVFIYDHWPEEQLPNYVIDDSTVSALIALFKNIGVARAFNFYSEQQELLLKFFREYFFRN